MVTEPTTMLTDYVLAAVSAWFALSLWRSREAGRGRVHLWVLAFAVTAFAALAGGTAHGLRGPLGAHWARVWSVTVGSIALGSALLILAGARSALRSRGAKERFRRDGITWLKRAIVLSLVALAVLVRKLSLHRHFNQNDLYHVIQLAGLYCLYRSARWLEGSGDPDRLSESGR